MSFPRPGKYRVEIIDAGIKDADEKGHVCFVMQSRATQEYDGQWYDLTGLPEKILSIDYYYLTSGKGIIDSKIKALAGALELPQVSVASLAMGDFKGMCVQVDVKPSEYNGKITNRVEWISHYDAATGVRKADDDSIKALSARWDRDFRKVGTGVVRPQAPRPAPSPAAVAVASAPPSRPPSRMGAPAPAAPPAPGGLPTVPSTGDGCWKLCEVVWDRQGFTDPVGRQSEWYGLLAEMGGEKPEDTWTEQEWDRAIARVPTYLEEMKLTRQ